MAYTVTEKARKARAEAARKPRGKWAGTPEREQLERAKAILREGLERGARFVADLANDPAQPAELRLQALKFMADRGGLPVMSQQHVDMNANVHQREVVVVEGGLGWPEVAGADSTTPAHGDHDGRTEQLAIQ